MIAKVGDLALKTQAGLQGPHIVGYLSEDTYERLQDAIASAYKLSYGVDANGEAAVRTTGLPNGTICLGLVLFWGDPSPLHDEVAAFVTSRIQEAALDVELDSASGGDYLVPCQGGSARTGIRTSFVKKNPDALWKQSNLLTASDTPLCTLEVGWSNESLDALQREVRLWMGGGSDCIGIKVHYRGQCGDSAAMRNYQPQDGHNVVSICILVGSAREGTVRRFGCGPLVPSRGNMPPAEGDVALLPLSTFTDDPDSAGRYIAIAASAIAYLVMRWVHAMASPSTPDLSFKERLSFKLQLSRVEQEAIDRLAPSPEANGVKRRVRERCERLQGKMDRL